MGWKNVKEAYRIGHFVCVTKEGICIGSGYIHNLIVIGMDGTIKKPYDKECNDELRRYQQEMAADQDKLRSLVKSVDVFQEGLPVYTYEGGEILLKHCEAYGWPNVTHDGMMMYENSFSKDKETVVKWAKQNADYGCQYALRRIAELEKEQVEVREVLTDYRAKLAKLEADYPETPLDSRTLAER